MQAISKNTFEVKATPFSVTEPGQAQPFSNLSDEDLVLYLGFLRALVAGDLPPRYPREETLSALRIGTVSWSDTLNQKAALTRLERCPGATGGATNTARHLT